MIDDVINNIRRTTRHDYMSLVMALLSMECSLLQVEIGLNLLLGNSVIASAEVLVNTQGFAKYCSTVEMAVLKDFHKEQ